MDEGNQLANFFEKNQIPAPPPAGHLQRPLPQGFPRFPRIMTTLAFILSLEAPKLVGRSMSLLSLKGAHLKDVWPH